MHIMYMLAIMSLIFIIGLFLMCFFREKLNHPLVNPLFISACAVFYFCWTYAMYDLRGGKFNFLTLENISPLICTVIVSTPFMAKWLKGYANAAVAFLSFGMFVAMFVTPEVEYIFNYNEDANFVHVSEAACHLIMAFYGYYLVLSGKVELNLKNYSKSLVFIYSAIAFGIFINIFFKKSNFGMSVYGNYSIYFIDIFGSFLATLVAYLFGVLATITAGFWICAFVDKISHRKHTADLTPAEDTTPRIINAPATPAD